MSRAVFRYEGTIAQLQGDAMLAFFGAPVAHEDDPERAIFAGARHGRRDRRVRAPAQGERRASTSGSAPASTPGRSSSATSASDLRYEYTALGDAVNVAARMQTAAAARDDRHHGDDAPPRPATRSSSRTSASIEVKGKAEPVHAFRVLGRKAAPARRRGLESVGLDSPMVGRDEPLRRLAALLERRPRRSRPRRLRRRRAGHRQEPAARGAAARAPPAAGADGRRPARSGSRAAASRTAATCPTTCCSTSSARSSASRSRPTEAEARAALDRELGELLGDDGARSPTPRRTSPTCSGCRSGRTRRATTELDPDVLQGRYVAATHRLLRGLAGARAGRPRLRGPPLGRSGVDRGHARSSCRSPRSCRSCSWRAARRDGLGRLGADRPGARAVRRRAHRDPPRAAHRGREPRRSSRTCSRSSRCPTHVRDLILARAEGNPFFVEEVVRMLIERGVIVAAGRSLGGDRGGRRRRDPGDAPRPAARPHRPAARRREAQPAHRGGHRPAVPGARPRARARRAGAMMVER